MSKASEYATFVSRLKIPDGRPSFDAPWARAWVTDQGRVAIQVESNRRPRPAEALFFAEWLVDTCKEPSPPPAETDSGGPPHPTPPAGPFTFRAGLFSMHPEDLGPSMFKVNLSGFSWQPGCCSNFSRGEAKALWRWLGQFFEGRP